MSDVNDPRWKEFRALWPLDPSVTYLNHGAFGASPHRVIAARDRWYHELCREPLDFLTRRIEPLLAAQRAKLGALVGSPADDLVFVDNATTAMNSVADNVELSPGDEVLINDHEYGAVFRIWERKCRRTGATLVKAELPAPPGSVAEFVERFFAPCTARTRVVVFSHITSVTALVFPIREILAEAKRRNLISVIDGPHAVAQREVDLAGFDCDYYCASCHKWLCAPTGSGFLYVHPRRQAQLTPSVLSWGRPFRGFEPSWRDEFTWAGTRDPAAYLAVGEAIDFLAEVGFEAFRKHTHELARYALARLLTIPGVSPITPDDPTWTASMACVEIPPGDADALHQRLFLEHKIEVPVFDWNGRRLLRVSCHLYTTTDGVDRLVKVLPALL